MLLFNYCNSFKNKFLIKFLLKRFRLTCINDVVKKFRFKLNKFSKSCFSKWLLKFFPLSMLLKEIYKFKKFESLIVHIAKNLLLFFENWKRFRWKIFKFKFNNFSSLSIKKLKFFNSLRLTKLLTKITFCKIIVTTGKSVACNIRKNVWS